MLCVNTQLYMMVYYFVECCMIKVRLHLSTREKGDVLSSPAQSTSLHIILNKNKTVKNLGHAIVIIKQ